MTKESDDFMRDVATGEFAGELKQLKKANRLLRNALVDATSVLAVINIYPDKRSGHSVATERKCRAALKATV